MGMSGSGILIVVRTRKKMVVFLSSSLTLVISSSYDGLIRLMDVEKMVF